MTAEQLKLQIDTDITGKTLVKSITPVNVGENLKDIVDYVNEKISKGTYLVSTLPIGQLGDQAIVTDALSPTYLGILTGGGTVICPVWYNGTIWVSR